MEKRKGKITGKRVGVISLGCDKNRVDTEKMIALLSERHVIVNDIEKAQIIIVNTCAFLNASRKESVNETLAAAEYKKNGSAEKVIVTGCLPQKYVGELWKDLPEADAFLGVSDYGRINEVIDEIYGDKRVNAVGTPCYESATARVPTTDGYAYLKIADGCSNHCTYCLIPKIRGEYRSVPKDELIAEIKGLKKVRELVLVAQDTARYGKDLQPETSLVQLIREISALKEVEGIRLLYCYPENITDELIHEFSVNAKMIRYIDVPLQHADDAVLKKMNRKGTGEEYLALIEKLKREIPGIAVRSTFITGFPGETEEAFGNLLRFLEKADLFNAGFFKYSREEGTAAYNLPDQIKESVKTARLKKLYAAQKKIVKKHGAAAVGKTFKVFAEGFDENRLTYYGRAYFNAPDVDGKIYFFSAEEVKYGEFYNVKIIKPDGYDLIGERVL